MYSNSSYPMWAQPSDAARRFSSIFICLWLIWVGFVLARPGPAVLPSVTAATKHRDPSWRPLPIHPLSADVTPHLTINAPVILPFFSYLPFLGSPRGFSCVFLCALMLFRQYNHKGSLLYIKMQCYSLSGRRKAQTAYVTAVRQRE